MEDFYKILHPKLSVFIAAYARDGRANAMACSWITPASEDPPLIAAFLSKASYTRSLIIESRCFTVNVPSRKLLNALWIAGTKSGRRVDKLRLMNISVKKAMKVDAPIMEGCIGYLECKLHQTFDVGECTSIVGEVVDAYADSALFKDGVWDVDKAEPLLHLGGSMFTSASGIIKVR